MDRANRKPVVHMFYSVYGGTMCMPFQHEYPSDGHIVTRWRLVTCPECLKEDTEE